jgi:AraC-like DNA-binding protein
MPIFMDRHDVSEVVTAENVAQLHQQDLKIQDHFGCRGLTYWFDKKRKTAFCLIEAADKNDIIEMHNKAHGDVPNQIIEVEAGVVESFLGRIEDPEKAKNTTLNIIDESAFRIIMVINLKASFIPVESAQSARSLENIRNVVVKILNDVGGKVVRQSENNLLASFSSVTTAVKAAFKIKSELKKHPQTKEIVSYKIGLNAGVPVTDKKSLFEDTIKLAERMLKVIQGELIVSSEVRELYNGENPKPLKEEDGVYYLTSSDEDFLNLLMNFTEVHWNSLDLKVDAFTKHMGYSKSQLYRKMILLTGKSPNLFINEYRLDEALSLLKKNKNNVSEIAYEIGFSSPSYFSKCFYKRYGHLPSEYLL